MASGSTPATTRRLAIEDTLDPAGSSTKISGALNATYGVVRRWRAHQPAPAQPTPIASRRMSSRLITIEVVLKDDGGSRRVQLLFSATPVFFFDGEARLGFAARQPLVL